MCYLQDSGYRRARDDDSVMDEKSAGVGRAGEKVRQEKESVEDCYTIPRMGVVTWWLSVRLLVVVYVL